MSELDWQQDMGGAAFPIPPGGHFYPEAGLSKRDYFAAAALTGWLASFGESCVPKPKDVAVFAYQVADAMIEARRAPKEGA